MIKFADCTKFVSCPGSKYKTEYSPVVAKDGTVSLKAVGKVDFHAYIQSFREQTDIHYIVNKIANGDTSMLRFDGVYGDFTKYPTTLAEVLQLQIDSNKLFNSLPVEIKQKFSNDPNKFFAQSGSKEWFETISPVLGDDVKNAIFPPSVPDPVAPVEEVKE